LHQPELTAAAAQGKGTDLFAGAHHAHPQDRLILLVDRRPGHEGERHMLAVDRTSPWGQLLPNEQIVEIQVPEASA